MTMIGSPRWKRSALPSLLFGGTSATVIASLIAVTGDLNTPAYYLMGAGVIGAVAVYFAKESAGKRLPGSPPAAVDHAEAQQLATKAG